MEKKWKKSEFYVVTKTNPHELEIEGKKVKGIVNELYDGQEVGIYKDKLGWWIIMLETGVAAVLARDAQKEAKAYVEENEVKLAEDMKRFRATESGEEYAAIIAVVTAGDSND